MNQYCNLQHNERANSCERFYVESIFHCLVIWAIERSLLSARHQIGLDAAADGFYRIGQNEFPTLMECRRAATREREISQNS